MSKWDETVSYLKNLPADWRKFIEEKMTNEPNSVRVIVDNDKGKFWEYRFFHNGFECYVQAQEFTDIKNSDLYRIVAFNDASNKVYVRQPLKEGL